jgi:hypothetical protein
VSPQESLFRNDDDDVDEEEDASSCSSSHPDDGAAPPPLHDNNTNDSPLNLVSSSSRQIPDGVVEDATRRNLLASTLTPPLFLLLLGTTSPAQARGLVQFPCTAPLANTYHLLRVGTSLLEEEGTACVRACGFGLSQELKRKQPTGNEGAVANPPPFLTPQACGAQIPCF